MKIIGFAGDASRRCTHFVLMICEWRQEEALQLVPELMPYLERRPHVNSWPGTISHGVAREMMKFQANSASIGILIEKVLPVLCAGDPPVEDLSFLRDGRPYFITITHEHDVNFRVEPDEFEDLAAAIGAFNLEIQGDVEVPDKTY